jgi:hypothetical protein
MLVNGDFSDGQNCWTTWINTGAGASAATSVVNGILYVDIANGVDTYWYVQQIYPGLQILNGYQYTLRFDAWAQAGRPINVELGENGIDNNGDSNLYTLYGFMNPSLTTTRTTYTMVVNMSEITDLHARICFNMGANDNDVWIDDVSLSRLP